MNYYNEFNPWKAHQLRLLIKQGLIPYGHVDERSITDVRPSDLSGYTQRHFFAGIGGWSLALRLAGWPDDRPVWTASCPCNPYSNAGKKKGTCDTRDLWPTFFNLFREYQTIPLLGEQVEAAIKMGWFDRVCSDMETIGNTVGACVLGSHSVGKDHIRQRLYFFANSTMHGCQRLLGETQTQVQENRTPEALGTWDSVGSPFVNWRKLLAEPHVIRVADGVSSTVDIRPRLHAYGDAIDPQLAAEFIKAIL